MKKYSRDNARTPMQWDDSVNAGFTTGKPWMVVNPNCKTINVKAQINRDDSLFSFYQKLIALRKNQVYKEVFVYGTFESCALPEKNLMAYLRKTKTKKLFIAANYQNETQAVILPGRIKHILLANDKVEEQDGKIVLSGYQAVVMEVE
ncbi:MAG: hypothetical protein ACOCNB_11465 [Acetivibrio ethanolgignens]